jgi:hypothetical protein
LKKIAIIQSNYIPWKGYFDIIGSVDEFVILDDVQYTRRDWRNRNIIYGETGSKWLTIPVETKGRYSQKISETRVAGSDWADKHWLTVQQFYSKADFFNDYSESFRQAWHQASNLEYLSDINRLFIRLINNILGITTTITGSDTFDQPQNKNERLISICRQTRATHYLTGEAARSYLDPERFKTEGIEVEWADYSRYRQYKQLHNPFLHEVSIIDLIFNEGSDSINFLQKL